MAMDAGHRSITSTYLFSHVFQASRKPKMAYYYARDSYAEVDVSAEYGALFVRSGEPLGMKLFVTSERKEVLTRSRITAEILDLDGRVLDRQEWEVVVREHWLESLGHRV